MGLENMSRIHHSADKGTTSPLRVKNGKRHSKRMAPRSKTDFNPQIRRNSEGHYTLSNGKFDEEDTAVLDIYPPKTRAPKLIK